MQINFSISFIVCMFVVYLKQKKMINLDFEISKTTGYVIIAVVVTALVIFGVYVISHPDVANFWNL